jgi:hypothetical protein
MDPIDRANLQIIENLEKIIVEQNRRLDKAKQEISILRRQIEVSDEHTQFRINKVIEEFHTAIDKMVTPSLN